MIDFKNNQKSVIIDEIVQKYIVDALTKTSIIENVNNRFEVSVTFTDNQEIHKINKTFRNVDRETDVLSFPMINFKKGYNNDIIVADDYNPENGNIMLGDIVISTEKAMSQAEEYGHSFLREITYLSVHSMLHLLGYDHENDADRTEMRKKEENVLSSMQLTR